MLVRAKLTGIFPPTTHDLALLEQFLGQNFFPPGALITISSGGRVIQCQLTQWTCAGVRPSDPAISFQVDKVLRGGRYWGTGVPSLATMLVEIVDSSRALQRKYPVYSHSTMDIVPWNLDLRDRALAPPQ